MYESINESFAKLGILLLLDIPEGLEFGIDNIIWKIGTKFKGVKLIPLGTHIIAYSLKSENHMFKITSKIGSTFADGTKKGEEAEGYREGVKHYHFDGFLGPYPQQNLIFWSQTTRYITKAVLDKLDPIDKIQQFQQQYSTKLKENEEIDLAALTLDDHDQQQEIEAEQVAQQADQTDQKGAQNPGKFKVLSDTIYYSDIPRILTGSPSKVTQVNMDKTLILKQVLAKQWKNKQQNLLGELQYSFVHFIIGEGEESLQQWKKLVDLLVNSEMAYLRVQQACKQISIQKLVMDFIPVFYDQLNQFPNDFFTDQISKGNFITPIIKRLHEYAHGEEYSPKIKRRIQKLLKMVREKFGYQVDPGEEDAENKPVIVNQSESYF